jgi:hypothetical protein
MGVTTNQTLVHAYWTAEMHNDFDALARLRDPKWVAEWPQSGERIRGNDHWKAIHETIPGGMPRAEIARVAGTEDRWVLTPSFTLQRVAGDGDSWWVEATMDYATGESYHMVKLLDLRDGKVLRERDYWSAPFAAPDWRAQWVEPMGAPARVG